MQMATRGHTAATHQLDLVSFGDLYCYSIPLAVCFPAWFWSALQGGQSACVQSAAVQTHAKLTMAWTAVITLRMESTDVYIALSVLDFVPHLWRD